MLKVANLNVSIGPVPIIRNASLDVGKGEFCGLIGRNGAGKTTIMRALMEEARLANVPVNLEVASENDPSMRLYLRLGFAAIETFPFYIQMEWRPGDGAKVG